MGDLFIQANHKSTTIFALADGHPKPAITIALLEHNIRAPARPVNMVPSLAKKSLLGGGKSVESGYVSVINGEEFIIYDGYTAKIALS